MTVKTNLAGASNFVLQEALGAYTDEAYTNAKKLSSTGIVGGNPNIVIDTETFIGQMRWYKPMTPTVNVASLTNSAAGVKSNFATDYLTYIKTVRTSGAEKVNLQKVVTQVDGLAKYGRDFGETRAQDEHDAILAVLRGVALSEVLNGAAAASGSSGLGGQTFENDPTSKRYGFYVDLGANKAVVDSTSTVQGAARAQGFLQAFGMAFKDYEPEYAYLITSPEMMASLRSANLVDQDRVTDGNIMFNTIFQGKFRLIQTRATQGFSSAEMTKINTGAGVDIAGSKVSFLVLPGALAMEALPIDEPVEIQRVAGAYMGGGTTEIWNRWGYILHPAGYNWAGPAEDFPTNGVYTSVMEGSTNLALTSVVSGTLASTTGVWARKTNSALSLGILPVFHN
jgi:hypothetical protein